MPALARQSAAIALVVLAALAASGCTSTGMYSLRHDQPLAAGQATFVEGEYVETMPCDPACQGVSLTDALATFCGPPELFHEEYLQGDPGAIIAPVPKYHPLPTRPVFEPAYFGPPPGAAVPPVTGEPAVPTGPVAGESSAARSSNWRGPLRRFAEPRQFQAENPRLARNPLQDVTFPQLDPWHVPPERIAPGGAKPLLR